MSIFPVRLTFHKSAVSVTIKSGEKSVCTLTFRGGQEQEAMERAEFIVRAINSFDEMVAALENAKTLCEAIIQGYDRIDINHKDFRVQVTKWAQDFVKDDCFATAKAKGEAVGVYIVGDSISMPGTGDPATDAMLDEILEGKA